jgi:hypothetical protein
MSTFLDSVKISKVKITILQKGNYYKLEITFVQK